MDREENIVENKFPRPIVEKVSEELIFNMMKSLGIPRNFLPNIDQIDWGLNGIYHTLDNNLSKDEVDDLVVKMTIASSVGLFDGAIVYMWNKVIKTLRMEVESFGPSMVKTILGKNENIEDSLDSMPDNRLITLAYQLNIIGEDGKMFLQQCREVRNRASIAHPTNIKIDAEEMINFVNRCCKYGLANTSKGQGVELKEVLSTIRNENVTEESINVLAEKLKKSFQLQQEFFMKILYKKYIDPSENSFLRNNAINLAKKLKDILTPSLESDLVTFHNQILIKGDDSNHSKEMSQRFFENLGIINLLADQEKISIYNKAITNLMNTHYGYNNFYNEPPFAERLYEISKQINPIPETVIVKYVDTVLECFLGNIYGVSSDAKDFYEKMLKSLTPKGIEVLFAKCSGLPQISNCRSRKSQLAIVLRFYHKNDERLTAKQKAELNNLITNYRLTDDI